MRVPLIYFNPIWLQDCEALTSLGLTKYIPGLTINHKSTEDLQLNKLNKNEEMRVLRSELALFESPTTRVCVEAGGLQP